MMKTYSTVSFNIAEHFLALLLPKGRVVTHCNKYSRSFARFNLLIMLYLPNSTVTSSVCFAIVRPCPGPRDGSFIIELRESSVVHCRDKRSCRYSWSVDSGNQIGGTGGTGEWGLGVTTNLRTYNLQ